MTPNPLGRAAHRETDRLCAANQPTPQLLLACIDAYASLLAHRSGEVVRIQIGDAPAMRRSPNNETQMPRRAVR
jgi:hypothetical protein